MLVWGLSVGKDLGVHRSIRHSLAAVELYGHQKKTHRNKGKLKTPQITSVHKIISKQVYTSKYLVEFPQEKEKQQQKKIQICTGQ